MIDVFTKVVLTGACLFTFAWVILAQRRTIKRLSDAYLRLTHFQRVFVALAVIVCTVYAQKPSTNDVNGAAFLGGCGPLGRTGPTVTQPYRLESVSTNSGISYALPAGGAIRGTWHLTGAYEDVQKVTLDGFAFPLGSDLCTSLWAYTWGKVRPQLKNASNEIVAVGAPMSAIPDVSRFWTAATTNDTYLLTWENFAAGRLPAPVREDADGTVNAQIELFRNGDFITRSNDVECVYRRVIEPNPIVDPINPPDPDDPTRPLYPYGPAQDLSVIEETNAYCWVDIVVDNADAWVRFEGDGASNLADPSFAAKAGETNRVVILIGKTYKVTCDMPFAVVGKSDPDIDEWWEDGNTLWLNWPVSIWSVGDDEEPPLLLMSFGNGLGRGKDFTMFVAPSCLGGEFSWTNSCCAVYGSGMHFSYGCDEFCLCGGCSARGYYSYEGYRIGCDGNWCGCSWYDDDDRHGEDDPDDPEPTPGVSVSFDDDAVIYEDAYTNAPGNVVPWQSTTTKLHLEVHGGMKGGTAEFTFTNQEKLLGPDIPESINVPAGHCKKYEFTYRGQLPSGSTNDIVVTGTFTENDPEGEGDAATYTDEASTTSVKVELTPEDLPPMNPSPNRHIMGIHEKVNLAAAPAAALVEWVVAQEPIRDVAYFNCPWTGGVYIVSARCGGAQLDTSISVVEPVVECREARWDEELDASAVVGESGWVGMRLSLYLLPRTVSFEWIEMEEIPVPSSQAIQPTGYFYLRPDVMHSTHDVEMGAGKWSSPRLSDGSWTGDKARMPYACPPFVIDDPPEWAQGTMRWAIPVGCGELVSDANGGVEHALRSVLDPNPTDQVYEMEADGTLTIRKYNHSIRRDVSGRVWLDGSRVNAWWN